MADGRTEEIVALWVSYLEGHPGRREWATRGRDQLPQGAERFRDATRGGWARACCHGADPCWLRGHDTSDDDGPVAAGRDGWRDLREEVLAAMDPVMVITGGGTIYELNVGEGFQVRVPGPGAAALAGDHLEVLLRSVDVVTPCGRHTTGDGLDAWTMSTPLVLVDHVGAVISWMQECEDR